MIKILIADDNVRKVTQIMDVLNRISEVTEENMEVVPDIISAQRALQQTQYDLVLLDVVLPKRFGEDPEQKGGIQLLEILKSGNKYHVPSYIVGLTAHDSVFEEARDAFSESLWAVIKYEENSDRWERLITDKIKDIMALKSEQSRKNAEKKDDYCFDLAIICALSKTELQSILGLPGKWERKTIENDCAIYHIGTFKGEKREISVVAAAASQMGMAATSVLSVKMIEHFRPQYLIMTGIAAGVQGKVELGDILVADPSWDYGAGKFTSTNGNSSFCPDHKQIRIDPDIQGKMQFLSLNKSIFERLYLDYPSDKTKPNKPASLHVGPMASGSAVVSDPKIVEGIIEHERNLIGLEMETYGLYYAAAHCSGPRPTAFSIKAVCDFANSDKNDRFQDYAAYVSAGFMYYLVTEELSFADKLEK